MLKKSAICTIMCLAIMTDANALQYNTENLSFKVSGYGTVGMLEPKLESALFIGDWRVRGQIMYNDNIGAVYAIDQSALDKGDFGREAFIFTQNKNFGRIELGFTDSVARKLGLGLPDVGGLRINDKPLYNEKIVPSGSVIADTLLTSGRTNSLRVNYASNQTNGTQYGLSVSGITDKYDWAVDTGLKIKRSSGKIKTAYYAGASFMSKPDNFDNEVYSAGVTADWRAQMSLGTNVQYNSWIFGLTGRVIYDEKPVGDTSDGFAVGAGISYDLLKYTVSATYILSDTGVWHKNTENFIDHTAIASFRYKYSEYVDGWISGGLTSETPFISAGMRITF